MEKHNPVQLELFQGDGHSAMAQADSSRRELRPASLVRHYRKAVLSLVMVIFVSLVSYSFGVERGKNGALKATAALPPLTTSARQKISMPSQNTTDTFTGRQAALLSPIAVGLKQNEKKSASVAIENRGQTDSDLPKIQKAPVLKDSQTATYTVQVASIQQRKNISKELTHLKTKGYNGFDLRKGTYTVICVGKFNVAQEAKNMQQKLKSSYPDCMIRRL